jgi:hemerythrin
VRSLQWTVENSVFLPELDDEHQALFRAMQELRHAVVAGEPPREIALLMGTLSGEFARHFVHEERLMRETHYTAFDWHKRQHGAAEAKLATLGNCIRQGDYAPIFESLESLAGWLRDHTATADRMLGSHLRNYGRSRAAS